MKRGSRIPGFKKILIPVLALVLLLVAIRVALPYYLLERINGYLDDMHDYRGHVTDIDLHIWRGAYELKGVSLVKTSGKVPVPFLYTPSIDLAVGWRELFTGALVGRIVFHEPRLNFVKGPTKETSQTSIDKIWIDKTEGLFPFRIDRLAATGAEIHYRDFHSDPKINISLDNVYIEAENLTNSGKLNREKFASIEMYNKPGENDPEVKVKIRLDSFAEHPTFDMDFALTGLNLVRLNDFLRAYGNFDVQKGRFSLYSEITSSAGSYKGYVKPFFEDLDVVEWKKEKDRPLKLAWEAIVGAVASILKSREEEKVASKVPISGSFKGKDIDYWTAIATLLRNAFIEALEPGFEKK